MGKYVTINARALTRVQRMVLTGVVIKYICGNITLFRVLNKSLKISVRA